MAAETKNTIIAPALVGRCRAIILKRKSKNPIEDDWQNTNNYDPCDDIVIEHVRTGGNFGLMVKNNTIVIDCDTDVLYNAIPEGWKKSLTVITGREDGNGKHIFLDCPDSDNDKIILKNKAGSIGDIRGSDSPFYTVAAGSTHPDSKKKYKYLDENAPLVSVSWKDVKKVVSPFIESKREQPKAETKIIASYDQSPLARKLGLRIQDFAMPTKSVTRANGEIQGSHPIHGSTTGMNFSINTDKNVWHCFRCNCGGDVISWIAYAHCGVSEEDAYDLSPEQFKDVKRWLYDNGYKKEIEEIDDDYHDKINSQVDLSGILPKNEESLDLEKEIQAAKDRCLLPPFPELNDGIFKDYMEFGKKVSYSLEEFHFASLLSIASMALGRKVVIKVGMTSIYPNVFAMVVGQTTISGKSVACNMAVDNFSPAITYEEPIAKCYSTNLLRGTISEAALIQGLNDTYNSLWYFDDCGGFFEDLTTWNAHILGTMCSIYDGSPIERTLSKRSKGGEQYKWTCPFPFVSLLFNTTTKDIEQAANNKLFSSGFFPRIMWFYGQGGLPRKNQDVSEEDKVIIDGIKSELKSMREFLAPMQMDSITFGVCEVIEDWKIKITMDKLGKEDEAFRTAISRGFIHAYKIAAIMTMFDRSFQQQLRGSLAFPVVLKIPDKHALMAIDIVEQYLIPRMMHICDMCNDIDSKNHQVMVLKALTQIGGVAERSKILRQTHLNKRDLDSALSTLVESGEIKCHCEIKDGAKKPTTTIIKI